MKNLACAAASATWLALFLAHSAGASAAERSARLVVDIKISGTESMVNGQDNALTRISQSASLSVLMRSDGEPDSVNTKDPGFAAQMQRRADAVQAQVRAAQARPRSAAAPSPIADPAAQQQMLLRVQQAQQQCGNDQQCLMKAAMALSAQQVSADPSVQARLARYVEERQACEQQHAKDRRAREVCTAAAERRAGGSGDIAREDEEDARYLKFFGVDGCPAEFRASIDDETVGRYADVQGMVPYRIKHSAQVRMNPASDAVQLRLLCLAYNPVLDVKSKTLWFDGLSLPSVRTTIERTDRGRSSRAEESIGLRGEAMAWVNAQLRTLPVAGTRRTTIPLAGASAQGTVTGQLQVEMTWRFEDL